mmetsp:Transcript_23772/g.73904  ORF Transcript_23772/g.73904 Transcript_23772/m.73904 type:complete len:245 (+) Transcript_23772:109-843(+)
MPGWSLQTVRWTSGIRTSASSASRTRARARRAPPSSSTASLGPRRNAAEPGWTCAWGAQPSSTASPWPTSLATAVPRWATRRPCSAFATWRLSFTRWGMAFSTCSQPCPTRTPRASTTSSGMPLSCPRSSWRTGATTSPRLTPSHGTTRLGRPSQPTSLPRWSAHATSTRGWACSVSSTSPSSTWTSTRPSRPAGTRRPLTCRRRWPQTTLSSPPCPTTSSCAASRTSSQAATRPATTPTSGPR